MRVGRLEDEELHIRDVPTPEPGSEEARARSTTAGMRHSDLHLARGHDLT
jgi:D-arabinose 1-dehydrogenase-like Zn-dependent alcohol dehydrogenase